MKITVKQLTMSGLFIALGMVLPFLTGQIPEVGSKLLPLHIPALLCGFACGPFCGAIVGAVIPVLRSLIFGMPPMMSAIGMSAEMLAYGLIAGLLYRVLPKKLLYVYGTLLAAMLVGRVVWGIVSIPLYGAVGNVFTWEAYFAGAVLNALPGIALQVVLVPLLVFALRRAKVME